MNATTDSSSRREPVRPPPADRYARPARSYSVSAGVSFHDDFFGVTDMAERIATARRRYNERVALAAYYLAQRRGFEPGHELEDWLTAEEQISQ